MIKRGAFMIYITGDFHGDIDRFKTKTIKSLKKNDYLIICGDFGFIWKDDKKEEKILKWIGKRCFTTLFIDGTHDNIDKISTYPLEEVGGAMAHKISGRLYHLRRGAIHTLDDTRIFAFGGGESDDMDMRKEGETFWKNELPSEEEVAYARDNLKLFDNKVDLIITHQAPSFVELSMDKNPRESYNLLSNLFEDIYKNTNFQKWYFGSYHCDKKIPPRYFAVFKDVLKV